MTSLVWKTNYHKFEVVTNQAEYVNDKTHYWPGWKVWVDGVETPTLDPYNQLSQGLVTFLVPSGRHMVETRLTEPGINVLADIISAVTFVIAVVFCFRSVISLKKT